MSAFLKQCDINMSIIMHFHGAAGGSNTSRESLITACQQVECCLLPKIRILFGELEIQNVYLVYMIN